MERMHTRIFAHAPWRCSCTCGLSYKGQSDWHEWQESQDPTHSLTLHITHRNIQLKKSHLLEGNLEKREAPLSKQGWKKQWASHGLLVGKDECKPPHDHLTSTSRLTFLTTVLPAHGADSTARVGRKELYAKEGQWAQRTGGQAASGQAELWEAALGGSLLESEVRRSGFWSSLISSMTLNCS